MNKLNYVLVPMNEIDPEARRIAVAWVEGYQPLGFDLEGKHKLASDIMNFAFAYHKEQIEKEKKAQEQKAKPKPKEYGMTVELDYMGFDLEVYGFFKKGEPAVMFPVDAAYPGSSDEFIIERVKCEEKELDKCLPDETPIEWDVLEEKILDKLTN